MCAFFLILFFVFDTFAAVKIWDSGGAEPNRKCNFYFKISSISECIKPLLAQTGAV